MRRINKCNLICLLACLFLLCQQVYAQSFNESTFKVNLDHLSVNNGLSQSSILSIHQDKYGFLWFGTRDGLNKYNGYEFEVFKHKVGDSTSLAGNIINDIDEDEEGNIWAVTEKGLSKYDRRINAFTNYSLPEDRFGNSTLNVILVDSFNKVWVGGTHGLFIFDPAKGVFDDNFSPHPFKMVSAIKEDKEGNIWVGAGKFGIFKINLDKHEFARLADSEQYAAIDSRVEALVIRDDNQVWVGTYGSGLFLLNEKGEVTQHFSSKAKTTEKKISNDNIRALQEDNEGNLWVGTFSGLNIIQQSGVVETIHYLEGDPNGLSHNSVRSLLKDDKGTMWIGTYFGGVNVFDRNNHRFLYFYNVPNDLTSLSYNVVGAFSETDKGAIIIGTERGGINVVEGNQKHIRKGKGEYVLSTIKSLYKDRQGRIWAGIFKQGLNLFEVNSGSFTSYPQEEQKEFSGLKKAIINCMAEDNEGFLWLGLDSDGGLFRFNLATNRFEVYPNHKELQKLLGNSPVKGILITDDNLILLATKGKGVVTFDPANGNIKQYNEFLEFNDVFKDSEGVLWFSSNGEGVFSVDTNGAIKQYHTEQGLLGNIILGTMEDDDHNLWFVSTNGLSKMERKRPGHFRNYSSYSNFPLGEINEGAFFKAASGEFLIGGSNGYVRFFPQALEDNPYVPPIVLTHLSVLNNRVMPGDNTGVLKDELNKTKKITLNHFQSILTMEFASLNFIQPENNQYAYKLVGFEEDWVLSDNRRSVTYTNLPDGEYTFMVKGSNNDGIWNEQPLELKIKILPPPWRTWWAYCIYAFLIVCGFLVIRRNAIKSTQLKHSLKLEQFEKEKWKEVHDLKLRYFIDVSHEFRTPLTLILSPLEEILALEEKNPWIQSRLKIMYFNAKRLLLLIDQILEIRAIEIGHSTLDLKPLSLSIIIQDIVENFKPLADKKGINLIYQEYGLPETSLLLDQDKIQKVFFNLLFNAFKFTPEGGDVAVAVRYHSDQYYFEVRDTGVGMNEEVLKNIFVRFYKDKSNSSGTGIGLTLTQSLVKIMNGDITVSSREGRGTIINITIPFEEAVGFSQQPEPASRKSFEEPIPLAFQDAGLAPAKSSEEGEIKESVLIVEDNPDLRKYMEEQLSPDYSVLVAENGKIGLEKANRLGPNLIVSDLMMPEMDGYELLKAIKSSKELCHIPVILLTAKSTQINKIEGLEHGADDYVTKPFNILELKVRIKNILGNRKLLHEKYRNNTLLPDSSEIAFNSADEKLLTNIVQTMKDNLDNSELSVEFLGKETGLSRVHLFRKLKALTGMSPTDFIIDFRIKNACQMLATGKFKIADVAYGVGYQDTQYFSKSFRKKMGISPSEYLKKTMSKNK